MKTSHTRGLNNSELKFCICLSFSSVTMVQMYRVYYRIVFKRLRQHPLTTKLVIGAFLAYADKGMITPLMRICLILSLDNTTWLVSWLFLRSNNSILTCLFYLWLSLVEKMFGLLAFLSSGGNGFFFGIDFCII